LDKALLDKMTNRIETYENEIIEVETNLTAIPALAPENGGEGELEKSQYIQSYLQDVLHCDELNLYKAPDDRVPSGCRPNLVAKFNGKSPARTLWIMSHMDVVPPGDLNKWNGDPWTVRVEDGKIIGRGTEDNQQGIVSSFCAVKAVRDEKITPEFDIVTNFR